MLGTSLDGVSGARVARRQRQDGVNAIRLQSGSIWIIVRGQMSGINISFARLATRASLRRRLGRLTSAVAAIVALRERPVFSCGLGRGERRRLIHLAVINAPVFGGPLDLQLPGAADDQLFEVLLIEELRLLRLRVVTSAGFGER